MSMQLRPRESQRRHWYVRRGRAGERRRRARDRAGPRGRGARTAPGSAVSTGGCVAERRRTPGTRSHRSDSRVWPELSGSGPTNQNVQRSIGSIESCVPPPYVVLCEGPAACVDVDLSEQVVRSRSCSDVGEEVRCVGLDEAQARRCRCCRTPRTAGTGSCRRSGRRCPAPRCPIRPRRCSTT